MKPTAYFAALFLLIALLFVQCNKDDTWGDASALKDGATWNAMPNSRDSGIDDQLFDISSEVLSQEGFLREELSFFSVPKKAGFYKLAEFDSKIFATARKQCTVGYSTYAGDGQAEGNYTIAKGDSIAFLEITEVCGKKIKGKFSATLLLTEDSKMFYPYLKDTVVFTDGFFHTKLGK